MRNRLGHKMALGWIAAMLFLLAGNAQAVSLGKIEVASHLGEPFYAEIPLSLDANESISRVFVEIAAPTDYRILEVYRDGVLNSIRADVESDSRGTRIELSSRGALDTPFFNMVLKVRYDRATHFKKYPIFLDLPKAIQPTIKQAPLPSVHALKSPTGVDTSMPTHSKPVQPVVQKQEVTPRSFTPYDGWARTGRYGPMVYGDTISTVAERLRVDDTFTRQQVMVALFEKNRAKFDQDNINIIKAGTYLDVPKAAEVERIAPSQARQVIAEHEKRWKELKQQPRYAAVAEAQKHRYSKRVRLGNQANGVAAAPTMRGADKTSANQKNQKAITQPPSRLMEKGAATGAAQEGADAAKPDSATSAELAALKKQNDELQARLAENEKQLEALKNKTASESAAAATARVEKLELKLARLQSELDAAREQAASTQEGGSNWLTWLLGGLVVVLLGVVGMVMRREPPHPAAEAQSFETPESVAEAAAADTAAAEPVAEDDIPEIEVEEADVEALSDDVAATAQMTAEQSQAFTDSIPDLTDEDTGEMPAFTEEVEEEPDPNVDYLSEADVYMRYGMEDEALQQVNMALRLKPNQAEAHIKKAEVLKAKGADDDFNETIAEATQTLSGDDLERFNQALRELKGDTSAAEAEVSLEDTMPPTDVGEMISEQVAGDGDISSEETISSDTKELDDFGFGDAEMDISSPSAGMDDTVVETAAVEDGSELDAALSDLDDLDLGDDTEVSGASEDTPASVEAADEPAAEAEVSLDDDSSGGLDFDLSDVELPETGSETAEADAGPQVETADLDKTVAMDWSKDTSVDSDEFDLMGESGADEPMFEADETPAPDTTETSAEVVEASEDVVADVPETPVEEEGASASPEEEITLGDDTVGMESESEEASESEEKDSTPSSADAQPETTASLDLDEGDLDDGFDVSEAEVEPADDFTSTIRTSLDEVAATSEDFTATGEHDLQFNIDASENLDEGMLEPVSGSDEPEQKNEQESSGGITIELEEDEDATQKLDNLLSQFDDEDKKD